LKGKSNFGYRLLLFIALAAVIANATARAYRPFYRFFVPKADSPEVKKTKKDSLKFPIHDKTGDPVTDNNLPKSIDLADPPNINRNFEYDADSNRYNYNTRLGNDFLTNPTYLTLDEYTKYKGAQDERSYWQRRMDALMLFNKTPELPQMYKEGLFDRIFGSNTIQVKPQGNVDVTFGGLWQNIKNPTLTQQQQRPPGMFDFDMQMNINLLATIGDKLKLNISNNTKATFDYQNIQKLDYSGKEDEMLKKIEAGTVSFPLKSSLINGVQSLFGIKTQLQFGKLWVTAVVSQQKSQRKSLTIQGGAQSQQIAIKAYNYEENKNFFLAHYFRDNYNEALKDFPKLNSLVTINKIEVWITNKMGAVSGTRKVMSFMDLGEATPHRSQYANAASGIRRGLPDNSANFLYARLQQNPAGRQQSSAINAVLGLGLEQGEDFEPMAGRQLSPSEFSFNAQLGYIMLNTQMNPDDVLGIAYRYTYRGKVYQVGEFSSDLPPDTANQKVLFLKLLKGTAPRTTLPIWKLMMKNVYALGGFGVSKENFSLNILYQDPGGGEKRYIPEGPNEGVPFITLLNLDKLNAQNEPQPDGVFDFVEGITINTQQGKVIFPVLEPFGNDLSNAVGNDPKLRRRYVYQVLYDSTKFVAQQYQQNDRFIMRGTYKSSSSSEIFLGGFNIPPGSVSVSAGGTKLVENQDYQIEYGLGRIKILNTGILNSGVPINIQYEDNATFGFTTQGFTATRLDYYVNKNLTLGSTLMRLKERPNTFKVTFGDDPIKNSVVGLDANYQSEVPAVTRIADKLPIYSTTAPSFLNSNLEVAGIFPGHPSQINGLGLDPEGAVYIDDFEGTSSNFDLKFPAVAWSLSAAPRGALDRLGQAIIPEGTLHEDLRYGMNRARLAWYNLEPLLVSPNGNIPDYIRKDSNQHYIRMVQQPDIFPARSLTSLQGSIATFDLGFYPKSRGPYNFDVANVDPTTGALLNPKTRWGGIMRPIDNTDFEASNVQYVQFWLLDPFIGTNNPNGGSLYINLGNVSEDVLKDSRMFFENSIPSPFDASKLETTAWGYVPRFEQQITRAFDNNNTAREAQDVGYDGLPDVGAPGQITERTKFAAFLNQLRARLGATNPAYLEVEQDPASDNFKFYRDSAYNGANTDSISVLTRYKKINNPQGNSPISDPKLPYVSSATTIPESEDINRDNSLNESESYFQYRIDLRPGMQVGENNIVNIQTARVSLPNGTKADEKWYQFKVPIQNYDRKVGGISDFRSIRFMRLFMHGWEDSVILRFATLEMGRNQWRTFRYDLNQPGENLPQQNQAVTDFTVTSVSLEENGQRDPVPYNLPPGLIRQQSQALQGQQILSNEQSLSLRTCALQDGDARGVFKEVNVDMRQFAKLRFFMHAESMIDQAPVRNADVSAFIRIGSDFTNNYYEYQVPLAMTPFGVSGSNREAIWPANNNVEIVLQELVEAKKQRDIAVGNGFNVLTPFITKDSKGNIIKVVGTPNLGGAKNIMLGVVNPKKTNQTPGDDGLPKCFEVWFDELRMAGLSDREGYAAAGKVSLQVADLGNVNVSGSMHTQGYGNIDQKLQQRSQDDYYQYNTSTNLSLGRMMPRRWGVQLPLFVGYTESVSTPRYNPYDQDVLLKDAVDVMQTIKQRDSLRSASQDFTSISSFNLTNVRIQPTGKPSKSGKAPWSIKNFDFTYSYNNQVKHNPIIERDELNTQRLAVGYTYSMKVKSFEPFKDVIKSKSRWWSLIKDVNLTPLPSTFTFRNELNRVFQETYVRNINDGSSYRIPPNYFKNFTWMRNYTLRWELTRSIAIDYSAINISRINEPFGRINTAEKRDTVWDRIKQFGLNNSYAQTFNSTYNVPTSKLPLTDWINMRLGYAVTYNWTTAPPVARELGNLLGNTNTKTATGDMNFTQLYNKSRWYRALSATPAPKGGAPATPGMPKSKAGGGKSPSGLQSGKPGSRSQLGKSQADVDDSGPNEGQNMPDGKKGKDKIKDKDKDKKNKADTTEIPKTDEQLLAGINTANMTDAQLDSVVKVLRAADRAKASAEKAKKKKAKKDARKLRRSKTPQLSTGVRVFGRIITMLNRVTGTFTETGGTQLPGYMDSTRFMGINNLSGAPGYGFVYGYQPDYAWLAEQAAANRLSRDSLFNSQLQQTYSRNLSGTATLQPHKDFRIDLNMTQTFSKSHSELYADTGTGVFNHFNPYETGSFNITYITINSMFKSTGVNSGVYNQFLANRQVMSARLGASNPYTNGLPDPLNPNYSKGYGPYSQDVLVPAFIAAYSGNDAQTAPMLDYKHNKLKDNPFRYFVPMPNWKVTFSGLNKVAPFSKYMTTFQITHGYTGTLAMNSFNSSLLFNDLYGLGFPSFIDSNSGNYIPYFQAPNVTITQAMNPLIKFDMAFKSNLTTSFEVRKAKSQSLSMIDYQVAENTSTEYVVGVGFRKKGIRLPFEVFGVKKLKNELIAKIDVGVRDDRSTNTFLANNISVTSRGQKMIRISPTIDYSVRQNLTLRLYFDRQQTIPYVSNSYPMTTTKAGVTFRFIFAQ
jgi:cell surface protein SprA